MEAGSAVRDNKESSQKLIEGLPPEHTKNLLMQSIIAQQTQLSKLEEFDTFAEELKLKNEELEENNKELHEKKLDLQNKNQVLEEELEYNKGRKEELKKEVEDLKKEADDLTERNEEKQDEINHIYNANRIVGDTMEFLKRKA